MTPVNDRIPFNVPYVTGNEMQYLEDVVTGGHFAGNGPYTKRVQALLEERYDVPQVLLTHSCTGALELAALLTDVGPGDEVILPSYTFATTASAFLRTGATIVFADVDPQTMNIDPEDVRRKITPRTSAIVPVHYAGVAADLDAINEIAIAAGASMIEDAAQGLDARLDDRWLGTIGRLGTISFHETKNLHAGLAGALFVNDPALVDRAEDIWERGTNRSKMFKGLVDKYTWVELGSSFYPSELQAAFLLAQLESIDANLATRRLLDDRYREQLAPLATADVLAVSEVDDRRSINYHAVFIVLNSVEDADTVREGLMAEGISAYIGYVPLHSSPMGERLGYQPTDLPVTHEYAPRVLRLPMHHEMSVEDVDRVVASIGRLLGVEE